jgi:hypothetical protein
VGGHPVCVQRCLDEVTPQRRSNCRTSSSSRRTWRTI